MSYKDVAIHVQCESSRAVGQALKKNPFAPSVPCHRVISSDKTIGGFGGSVLITSAKIIKKRCLLEKEGVLFIEKNGKLYLKNDENFIHKLPVS